MFKGKYIFPFFILIIPVIYFAKNLFPPKNIRYDAKIKIASSEINVQLAKTPEEKSKGLSGKNKLAGNEGMLFSFPQKTYPIFWMKDMKFNIDLLWINDDKVLGIEKNMPAPLAGTEDKDLLIYSSAEPVNRVLEINGGLVDQYGLKVGDSLEYQNINF